MRIERLEIVVEPWRREGGYAEVRVKVKANGIEYNTYDIIPENDFEPLVDVIMRHACVMIKWVVSDAASNDIDRKEAKQ